MREVPGSNRAVGSCVYRTTTVIYSLGHGLCTPFLQCLGQLSLLPSVEMEGTTSLVEGTWKAGEAVCLQHLSKTPRRRVVSTFEANVYVADDVDWAS